MALKEIKTAKKSPTILGVDGQPAVYSLDQYGRKTAYEGASREGSLSRWRAPRQSADAAILAEKDILDDRARDLIRNEPIAKSAVNTSVDLVIGTGPIVRPQPDYKALGMTRQQAQDWARDVSNKFHDHFDSTDIDASRHQNGIGLLRAWYRDRLATGEGAVLPLYLPDRPGVDYGLALQSIDTDRISNKDGMPDSKYLRKGVQIDDYGAPVAYHIRKAHEFDSIFFGSIPDTWTWEIIQARNSWGRPTFMHSFDKTRPDQHRGVGLFSEILPLFSDLHKYKGAELKAAIANAFVAGITQTDMSMEELVQLYGGDAVAAMNERSNWFTDMGEGGAIIPLFPGDTFQSHNPSRPNTAFDGFVMSLMRQIAANTGLPYEIIMKDFTTGSYSSLKAVFNVTWLTVDPIRDVATTDFMRPIYEMWLEEAVARGIVEAPGFFKNRKAWSRIKCIYPGRGWLDEVREGQASQLRLVIGTSTLENECARQGLDYEEVIEQRAIEQRLMEAEGLDMSKMLTTISVAPTAPLDQQDQQDQQDNSAAKPKSLARRIFGL